MTETFRDDLRMDSGLEGQRCVRVAKVVEPDLGQVSRSRRNNELTRITIRRRKEVAQLL